MKKTKNYPLKSAKSHIFYGITKYINYTIFGVQFGIYNFFLKKYKY
jgi:hypothetical protein